MESVSVVINHPEIEIAPRETLIKRVVRLVFFCWYARLRRRHTSIFLGMIMFVVFGLLVLAVVYRSRVRASRLLSVL